MSFIVSQINSLDLCHIKIIKYRYIASGRKGEAIIFCNHLNSVMSVASDLFIETGTLIIHVTDNRASLTIL